MVPVSPPPPEKNEGCLEVGAAFRIVDQLESLVGFAFVIRGEAAGVLWRDRECGVGHAERIENRILQILIEPLAGNRLDQVAADVGRERVHPVLTGSITQWHFCELVDEARERLALGTVYPGLAIGAIDRMIGRAVSQAALMAKHVAHRHRTRGNSRLHRGALAGNPDLVIAPFRNKSRDRIIELEMPLLVEAHQRDRGDRLRHRVEAEDRVVGHRRFALAIRHAHRLEVGDVAVARDERLASGDLPGLDIVAVQMIGNSIEPIGRESCAFR